MKKLMGDRASLLKTIAKDVRKTPKLGDWYDDRNLLHCGKCGEVVEAMIDVWKCGFTDAERQHYVRPIACACDRGERPQLSNVRRMIEYRKSHCFDFPALKEATFEADDGLDAATASKCRKFVKNFETMRREGIGLILSGEGGRGKTFMAACIANALLDKNWSVRFTSIANLGAEMAEDYGSGRKNILARLSTMDLVVLDDLGKERETSTMNENLYQIVNTLYACKVPMVFTTNFDTRDMIMDNRPEYKFVYSRIFERCKTVNVEGPDRRMMGNDKINSALSLL